MREFRDFKKNLKEEVAIVQVTLRPKFDMGHVEALKNLFDLEFMCVKEILKLKKKDRKPNLVCPKQLLKGMRTELEHIDITNGEPVMTAKIALAHLREYPAYYDELEKMEKKFKAKK